MQCRQRIYQIWVEDLELARLLPYIGGLKGTQDNQRLQAKTTMQCPENVAGEYCVFYLCFAWLQKVSEPSTGVFKLSICCHHRHVRSDSKHDTSAALASVG